MNVLTLKVDGSVPGELTFVLQRPAGNQLRVRKELDEEISVRNVQSTDTFFLLNQLLPPSLTRELGQWVLDDPTPGLLAVNSDGPVDAIPWEYLPQLLKMPTVFVVRHLVQPVASVDKPAPSPSRLLAAGWSGKPTFELPGIKAELTALGQLGTTGDFQVQVLFEPSLDEFAWACDTFRPDLLHLIPPGISHDNAVPEIILSGDEQIQAVPIDQFMLRLNGLRPRLVVLNTCDGGSAIRMLAEHLGTMVIGWLGVIQDHDAVDFARFMYARILDGESVIGALRSYRLIQPSKKNLEQATRDFSLAAGQQWYDPVPVVWTPSIALLTKSLRDLHPEEAAKEPKIPVRQVVEATTRRGQRSPEEAQWLVSSESSLPTLIVEFEPQKWLNPALLKNGRPAVNRLVLTSDRALRNVGIAVSCDTGNGISTVRQTLNLEKGPQPVPIDTWQFPVLYELIGAAVPRRQINFTISCSLAGGLLAETTKPVLWMGRTEWLDKPDTWHFIPAFVDPYCDGVLDVIGKADEVLKQIAAPTSSFDAYQTNDSRHVTEQVKAVFNCLRDKPYELHYIAPPPIPVFAPGEMLASGQRIRPLDEVVKRSRGTCHDLAVLFASCLEQIQIYPLIILITGHTFFGFWKDCNAHDDFWSQAGENRMRRPSDPAREWTIIDPAEIQQLLDRDVISLVDAVMVTDRNAKFEAALKAGYDYYQRTTGINPALRFDVGVDIQASRRVVQPL
jgi:hypothetical protein